MNILELNKKLYETLEALENDKIDIKKADGIVNVANAITNNTKLLINVAKIANSENVASLILGDEAVNKIESESTYSRKVDFALSLGYSSVPEAMGAIGSDNFNRKFQNEKK